MTRTNSTCLVRFSPVRFVVEFMQRVQHFFRFRVFRVLGGGSVLVQRAFTSQVTHRKAQMIFHSKRKGESMKGLLLNKWVEGPSSSVVVNRMIPVLITCLGSQVQRRKIFMLRDTTQWIMWFNILHDNVIRDPWKIYISFIPNREHMMSGQTKFCFDKRIYFKSDTNEKEKKHIKFE